MKELSHRLSGFRMAIAAVAVCCGARSASAQTQNTISSPSGGGTAYARTDTVTAYGTVHPFFAPFATMEFGTGGGSGSFTRDPNTAAVGNTMLTVDTGAAFGFPNQYIVWTGTKVPNANGWTPSPSLAFPGFPPFPIPDHVIEFTAGTSVEVGPFWVF